MTQKIFPGMINLKSLKINFLLSSVLIKLVVLKINNLEGLIFIVKKYVGNS